MSLLAGFVRAARCSSSRNAASFSFGWLYADRDRREVREEVEDLHVVEAVVDEAPPGAVEVHDDVVAVDEHVPAERVEDVLRVDLGREGRHGSSAARRPRDEGKPAFSRAARPPPGARQVFRRTLENEGGPPSAAGADDAVLPLVLRDVEGRVGLLQELVLLLGRRAPRRAVPAVGRDAERHRDDALQVQGRLPGPDRHREEGPLLDGAADPLGDLDPLRRGRSRGG